MDTNKSTSGKSYASANGDFHEDDNRVETTPVRKNLFRSPSVSSLDGDGTKISTPTAIEDTHIIRNSRATRSENDEVVHLLPIPRPSSFQATPIQSNVRKKPKGSASGEGKNDPASERESSIGRNFSTGGTGGCDDKNDAHHLHINNRDGSTFERPLLKGFSFEKNNHSATLLEEGNALKDDSYGHYLSTSSFEDSPKRQEPKSISLDQATSDNNANTNIASASDGEPCGKEDGFAALTIPELSDVKQKISFVSATTPGHRRHISWLSEMSSGSEDAHDDESLLETPRDDSRKIFQWDSDQRLSLTVDMETGKSPGKASLQFHRGQHAIRRSYSSDMMGAQSPRTRRRRALTHNMDQLRRGLLNNVEQFKNKRLLLPTVKSANDVQQSPNAKEKINFRERYTSEHYTTRDLEEGAIILPKQQQEQQQQSISDSNHETLKFADRKRRTRYSVEPKTVRVPNDKQSRNYHDEVQYRLSAITPVELRRRRYRDSIRGASGIDRNTRSWIDRHAIDANSTVKNDVANNDDTNNDEHYAIDKCNQCLISVGNFLTELVVFILSQGKQNNSVGLVNKFLYWTFRKHFFVVLFAAACSFYIFTVTFAVFIYLIGKSNPKCIHVNGVDFGDTREQFGDAFALSWTTFSTVGYGLVYPGTSGSIPDNYSVNECWGITIITTMEAFVGILFSGVWGAIWFAKVTRVSSFAQVSFSDAVIVKYGTGVTGAADSDEYEEGSSDDDDPNFQSDNSYKQSKLPCPFLEFRIANRLHRQRGGEIIDASINIVASMEESQATRFIRNGAGMVPKIRRKGRRPKSISSYMQFNRYQMFLGDDDVVKETNIKKAQEAAKAMVVAYTSDAANFGRMSSLSSSIRTGVKGSTEIDEEQKRRSSKGQSLSSNRNTKPFPNQIFAKLNVEALEHPFLKRVWNVRHVLDERSPLLKQEAKDLIRLNNGHWPEELNNATAVRASIHFDQILVSFSGTSNVDANSVYSQKAYNFGDVCVGYAFCNMLFRESDGSIGVDHSLLNDVKEQSGGGGEDLFLRNRENSNGDLPDILIL